MKKSEGLLNRLKNQRVENVFSLYPPFPTKNLLIEVTNSCNYKCIFCANRKMTRKKGTIRQDFLEKILNEAFRLGSREVGFYTTGEPLIYKDLDLCISKAKKIGFEYVYLTTNGYLATAERIEQLVKSGLDSLKFSINAFDNKTYQLIHGENSWDKVMENLYKVNKMRKEKGYPLKLYVSYIMTKYTKMETAQVKSTFSKYCDEVVVLKVRNQSGLTPEINECLSIESERTDYEFALRLPCNMPFNTVNISYEGYLTACCADFQNYLAYADLNKVSIKDAWVSDEIVHLRKMHLEKNVRGTLCNNCVYGLKTIPTPLKVELAVVFGEELFHENSCQKRIYEFLKKEEDNRLQEYEILNEKVGFFVQVFLSYKLYIFFNHTLFLLEFFRTEKSTLKCNDFRHNKKKGKRKYEILSKMYYAKYKTGNKF